MKSWADRFRKSKNLFRRRRRRRNKRGCKICGKERFAHKPNSYYGHLEHAYRAG